MTRSIFDPAGGETEHSGSLNMGPAAGNISHLPPDAGDSQVEHDEMSSVENGDAASPGNTVPGFDPGTAPHESPDVERAVNPGQGVE